MSGADFFDTRMETVDDVVEKMDQFEKFLDERGLESFRPFLRAYRKITLKVIQASEKDVFDNPGKLEELDIRFAEPYFEAMEKYFLEGEKKQPWKEYLNYVERDDSRPVLELLLGINAHINADLGQAMKETDYSERQDFEEINRILLEALIPVMADTAVQRKDFETLGFLGVQPVAFLGLKKVVQWREQAWKNRNKDITVLRKETERKACELIGIRHDNSLKGLFEKPGKILSA
ncbi:DUF5995 family protein [Candidatus Nanosalina sp. VS9-1]|uniref:DUF5995 family protein n=1 Tax=Candidatus Nanosalina sp. VS9-1 TaxID=3388566 RepID=UPI0039DF555F